MSILSALKARGAKGKNIEEAVKTLPLGSGGGSDDELLITVTWHTTGSGGTYDFNCTYDDIASAFESEKKVYVKKIVHVTHLDKTWVRYIAPATIENLYSPQTDAPRYEVCGIAEVLSNSSRTVSPFYITRDYTTGNLVFNDGELG